MARRLGATEGQVTALAQGSLSEFSAAWQVAFRVAEEMTTAGGRVAGATYEALKDHWSPAQIVEITCVIGLFNYFNRIANALDIPPTK